MCLSDHAKPTQQARAVTSSLRGRELYLKKIGIKKILFLCPVKVRILARVYAAGTNKRTVAVLSSYVLIFYTDKQVQEKWYIVHRFIFIF